jgi:hypothetical protein
LRDDEAIANFFNEAAATLTERTQKVEPLSPHAQAIVAGALARLLTFTDSPAGADSLPHLQARAALDRAWQSVPAHQHIALLPWIGWAEADFARAADKPLAHEDDLRLMRDTLGGSRILADTGAPVDLIGGFSLTTAGTTLDRPTSDAQTVRPAAWMASIIRDERFTSTDEAGGALADHFQTIRFIMQLTAREAVLATCRNPDRARGGIRAAPWDLTQPVPAQALALITAVQTLQAIEKPAAVP